MIPVYCLFVFGLAHSALSDLNLSTEPCSVTDIECLSKNTQNFLDRTSAGNPKYDIKPIDPITIPQIDKFPEGTEGSFHLKDVKVTGFKDQKISSFKLDKDTKTVNLKTKVDFSFDSDITIKLHCHDPPKVFSGTLKAKASAEGSATYVYSIIKDDEGVEHYEVGPETITCEVLGTPTFTINDELQKALLNDADLQVQNQKYKEVQEATRRETICDVVKTVFASTVHNIRATARLLPKSAYFKDV